MSILELIEDFNEQLEAIVQGMDRACGYDELGLDPRAGRVWINRDCIITNNPRSLNYYGGFEYIDREYVFEVGDYTVYLADADRVQRCVVKYFELKAQRAAYAAIKESPTEV